MRNLQSCFIFVYLGENEADVLEKTLNLANSLADWYVEYKLPVSIGEDASIIGWPTKQDAIPYR